MKYLVDILKCFNCRIFKILLTFLNISIDVLKTEYKNVLVVNTGVKIKRMVHVSRQASTN